MCFCRLKKWIGSSHEYWYKGLDFFFFFFLIVFMECCEMTLFHKCVWTNAFLLRAWILVFTYAVLINLARKNYIRLSGLNRCLKFMKFACMFSYVNPRKVFISQSMYILVPSQSTCWFAARFHSWCLWHLTSWIPLFGSILLELLPRENSETFEKAMTLTDWFISRGRAGSNHQNLLRSLQVNTHKKSPSIMII